MKRTVVLISILLVLEAQLIRMNNITKMVKQISSQKQGLHSRHKKQLDDGYFGNTRLYLRLRKAKKGDGGVEFMESCRDCPQYGHEMLKVFDNVITCGDKYQELQGKQFPDPNCCLVAPHTCAKIEGKEQKRLKAKIRELEKSQEQQKELNMKLKQMQKMQKQQNNHNLQVKNGMMTLRMVQLKHDSKSNSKSKSKLKSKKHKSMRLKSRKQDEEAAEGGAAEGGAAEGGAAEEGGDVECMYCEFFSCNVNYFELDNPLKCIEGLFLCAKQADKQLVIDYIVDKDRIYDDFIAYAFKGRFKKHRLHHKK